MSLDILANTAWIDSVLGLADLRSVGVTRHCHCQSPQRFGRELAEFIEAQENPPSVNVVSSPDFIAEMRAKLPRRASNQPELFASSEIAETTKAFLVIVPEADYLGKSALEQAALLLDQADDAKDEAGLPVCDKRPCSLLFTRESRRGDIDLSSCRIWNFIPQRRRSNSLKARQPRSLRITEIATIKRRRRWQNVWNVAQAAVV